MDPRLNSVGLFNTLAKEIQGNEPPGELVKLLEDAARFYVSAGDKAPTDEAAKLGKKLEGWIKQPTFFAGAGPDADTLFANLGTALGIMNIAGGAYEAAKQTRQAARDAGIDANAGGGKRPAPEQQPGASAAAQSESPDEAAAKSLEAKALAIKVADLVREGEAYREHADALKQKGQAIPAEVASAHAILEQQTLEWIKGGALAKLKLHQLEQLLLPAFSKLEFKKCLHLTAEACRLEYQPITLEKTRPSNPKSKSTPEPKPESKPESKPDAARSPRKETPNVGIADRFLDPSSSSNPTANKASPAELPVQQLIAGAVKPWQNPKPLLDRYADPRTNDEERNEILEGAKAHCREALKSHTQLSVAMAYLGVRATVKNDADQQLHDSLVRFLQREVGGEISDANVEDGDRFVTGHEMVSGGVLGLANIKMTRNEAGTERARRPIQLGDANASDALAQMAADAASTKTPQAVLVHDRNHWIGVIAEPTAEGVIWHSFNSAKNNYANMDHRLGELLRSVGQNTFQASGLTPNDLGVINACGVLDHLMFRAVDIGWAKGASVKDSIAEFIERWKGPLQANKDAAQANKDAAILAGRAELLHAAARRPDADLQRALGEGVAQAQPTGIRVANPMADAEREVQGKLSGLSVLLGDSEELRDAYALIVKVAKRALHSDATEVQHHGFVMRQLDSLIRKGIVAVDTAKAIVRQLGERNLLLVIDSNASEDLKEVARTSIASADRPVSPAFSMPAASAKTRANVAQMLDGLPAMLSREDSVDAMELSDSEDSVQGESALQRAQSALTPRTPGAAEPVVVEIFKPVVIDLALPRVAPAAREAARAETRNMLLALGEPNLSAGARVTAVKRVRQAWAPVASEITFVDNSEAKRRQYVSDAYLRDLESLVSDELDAWTPDSRGNLESAIRFLSTDPEAAKEVSGHLDLILKVLELKKDGADALAKAAIPEEVGKFVSALTDEAFDLGQVGISALNLTRGVTPIELTKHLRDAFKDETKVELQAKLERLDAAKQSTQALNLYKNAIELVRRELVENIGVHEIREQRAQSVAAYLGHTKDAITALHGAGGSPDLVGALNALMSAHEHADKIIELDPRSAMSPAERRRNLMQRVIAEMDPAAKEVLAAVMHGPQLRELLDMAFAARAASVRQKGQPVTEGLEDVLADLMTMQQEMLKPANAARGGRAQEHEEAARQALNEVFGVADAFGIAIAANLKSIVNRPKVPKDGDWKSPKLRDGDWKPTFKGDRVVDNFDLDHGDGVPTTQMVNTDDWGKISGSERARRRDAGVQQMLKHTGANDKQSAMLSRVANPETLKQLVDEAMDPAHSPIRLDGKAGRLLGGEARNTFRFIRRDLEGNVRVHCVRQITSPTHFQAGDNSEPVALDGSSFALFEMEIAISPTGDVSFSKDGVARIECSIQPPARGPSLLDVLLSDAATTDDLTRSMTAFGQLQSTFSNIDDKMLWENHKSSHELRQELSMLPTQRLQALQRKLEQVDGFARQQRLASNDFNWKGRTALRSMARALGEILAVRTQVQLVLQGSTNAVDALRLKLSTTKQTEDDLRLMLAHLTRPQLAALRTRLEAAPIEQKKSWSMRVFSSSVKKDELLEAVQAAEAAPRTFRPDLPNEDLLPQTPREVRQDALINALTRLLDNEDGSQQAAKQGREYKPLPSNLLVPRLEKLSTQDLEQIASRKDKFNGDAPTHLKSNMATVMAAVQSILEGRKAALKKNLNELLTPALQEIAEGKSGVKITWDRKLMPSASLTMSVVREILDQRAAADERSPLEIVSERLDGQISALELAQHQSGLPSEDRIRALKQAAATLVTRAAFKQPGEVPPEPEPTFEKRFEQVLASLARHLSDEQLADLAPDFANTGVDFSASIESGLNARVLKLRGDLVAIFKGVVSAMSEGEYSNALMGLRKMRAKGNEILELDQRLHPGVQRQRDSIAADLTAGAVQALSVEQRSSLTALMDSDEARNLLAAIVEASTKLTGDDGSLSKELGGIAALWSNIRFSAGDPPAAQQPLDPAKVLEDEEVQATLLDVWNIEVGANQTLVKKPSTWLQDFPIESLTVLSITDPEAPSELLRDFTSYTESVYGAEGMHYLNALQAFNALDPTTQAKAAIKIGELFFRSDKDVDYLNFGGPDTGRVREVLDSDESGEKKLAKLVPLFQEFRTKVIEEVGKNTQLLTGFKAAIAAGRYGPPPQLPLVQGSKPSRPRPDVHIKVDDPFSPSSPIRNLRSEFEAATPEVPRQPAAQKGQENGAPGIIPPSLSLPVMEPPRVVPSATPAKVGSRFGAVGNFLTRTPKEPTKTPKEPSKEDVKSALLAFANSNSGPWKELAKDGGNRLNGILELAIDEMEATELLPLCARLEEEGDERIYEAAHSRLRELELGYVSKRLKAPFLTGKGSLETMMNIATAALEIHGREATPKSQYDLLEEAIASLSLNNDIDEGLMKEMFKTLRGEPSEHSDGSTPGSATPSSNAGSPLPVAAADESVRSRVSSSPSLQGFIHYQRDQSSSESTPRRAFSASGPSAGGQPSASARRSSSAPPKKMVKTVEEAMLAFVSPQGPSENVSDHTERCIRRGRGALLRLSADHASLYRASDEKSKGELALLFGKSVKIAAEKMSADQLASLYSLIEINKLHIRRDERTGGEIEDMEHATILAVAKSRLETLPDGMAAQGRQAVLQEMRAESKVKQDELLLRNQLIGEMLSNLNSEIQNWEVYKGAELQSMGELMADVKNVIKISAHRDPSMDEQRQLLLEVMQSLMTAGRENAVRHWFGSLSIGELSSLADKPNTDNNKTSAPAKIAEALLNERIDEPARNFESAREELQSVDPASNPKGFVTAAIRASASLEALGRVAVEVSGSPNGSSALEGQRKRREDIASSLRQALGNGRAIRIASPADPGGLDPAEFHALGAVLKGLDVDVQQFRRSHGRVISVVDADVRVQSARRVSSIQTGVNGTQYSDIAAGQVTLRIVDKKGNTRDLPGDGPWAPKDVKDRIDSAILAMTRNRSGVRQLAQFTHIARLRALEPVKAVMDSPWSFIELNGNAGTPIGIEHLVVTARESENGSIVLRFDYSITDITHFQIASVNEPAAGDAHIAWEVELDDKANQQQLGPLTCDYNIHDTSRPGTGGSEPLLAQVTAKEIAANIARATPKTTVPQSPLSPESGKASAVNPMRADVDDLLNVLSSEDPEGKLFNAEAIVSRLGSSRNPPIEDRAEFQKLVDQYVRNSSESQLFSLTETLAALAALSTKSSYEYTAIRQSVDRENDRRLYEGVQKIVASPVKTIADRNNGESLMREVQALIDGLPEGIDKADPGKALDLIVDAIAGYAGSPNFGLMVDSLLQKLPGKIVMGIAKSSERGREASGNRRILIELAKIPARTAAIAELKNMQRWAMPVRRPAEFAQLVIDTATLHSADSVTEGLRTLLGEMIEAAEVDFSKLDANLKAQLSGAFTKLGVATGVEKTREPAAVANLEQPVRHVALVEGGSQQKEVVLNGASSEIAQIVRDFQRLSEMKTVPGASTEYGGILLSKAMLEDLSHKRVRYLIKDDEGTSSLTGSALGFSAFNLASGRLSRVGNAEQVKTFTHIANSGALAVLNTSIASALQAAGASGKPAEQQLEITASKGADGVMLVNYRVSTGALHVNLQLQIDEQGQVWVPGPKRSDAPR